MRSTSAARRILAVAAVLGAALWAAPAPAAPVFFGWGGDKIVKIADLPPEAVNPDGKHYDLGYQFKQVTVFFIPVWNYDEHWAIFLTKEDKYRTLTEDEARAFADAVGTKLPEQPIPDWDLWQGKALVGAILAGFIIYSLRRKKPEASSPAAATPAV